jgi:prolyl-tRNA synthetase
VAAELRALSFAGRPVLVEVDNREGRGGQKQWEWIKKGIPLRLEIGPRDVERGTVSLARRDQAVSEKTDIPRAELAQRLLAILGEMQDGLFARAESFRAEHMRPIGSRDDFFAWFTPRNAEKPEIHGGFAVSPWCGGVKCEEEIKEALKVTIRCLPIDPVDDGGLERCVVCGGAKAATAVFAKSY